MCLQGFCCMPWQRHDIAWQPATFAKANHGTTAMASPAAYHGKPHRTPRPPRGTPHPEARPSSDRSSE